MGVELLVHVTDEDASIFMSLSIFTLFVQFVELKVKKEIRGVNFVSISKHIYFTDRSCPSVRVVTDGIIVKELLCHNNNVKCGTFE